MRLTVKGLGLWTRRRVPARHSPLMAKLAKPKSHGGREASIGGQAVNQPTLTLGTPHSPEYIIQGLKYCDMLVPASNGESPPESVLHALCLISALHVLCL